MQQSNNYGYGQQVAPQVYCVPILIVNVCFIGDSGKWVLVDTGLSNSGPFIIEAAGHHFGTQRKPEAIILTHGHFDHVGSIMELIKKWDVPVYAHAQELPYLTGQANYPEADPSVGGGLMAT